MGLFGSSEEKRLEKSIQIYENTEIYDEDRWKKAAKLGHVTAMYDLGQRLTRSYVYRTRGLEWLSRAAEEGDSRARYQLGVWYMQGRYVPRDRQKALTLFEQGGFGKDVPAPRLEAIEKRLRQVDDVDPSERQSVRKAGPNLEARRNLCRTCAGLIYEYGRGVPVDVEKAVEYYHHGFTGVANLRLSQLSRYGVAEMTSTYRIDPDLVTRYQDHPEEYWQELEPMLSILLEMPFAYRPEGDSYEVNMDNCAYLLHHSDGRRYPHRCGFAGWRHLTDQMVYPKWDLAADLFRRGYAGHDRYSAFALGVMQALDWCKWDPHNRDGRTPVDYLQAAAEWGFVPAQYNLALLLSLRGEYSGDAEDFRQAARWAEKYAASGDPDGERLLERLSARRERAV